MSSITDVWLFHFERPRDAETCLELLDKYINFELDEPDPEEEPVTEEERRRFSGVEKFAGGDKYPQIKVWAGAIDYIGGAKAFVEFVFSLPFKNPRRVVLVIKDEHDDEYDGNCPSVFVFGSDGKPKLVSGNAANAMWWPEDG